jgi:hypothetical protein
MVEGPPLGEVRWLLHTADAQGLYGKLGFSEHAPRYPLMERERRRTPQSRSAPRKRRG